VDSTIRQAVAGDIPAVRDCVNDAFSPYISRIGSPPAPMLLDFDAHTRDRHVWVAMVADAIGGVLVQYETPEGFYVDTVASHSRVRGGGVGKALLVFAEREAARRGFDSLYLCTNSKMVENQALYTRVGYVEFARKRLDGYDRIYYRKPLV
jgi:GNAT superfamily N-acetyltransferase